jgi:hypothetical protein
LEQIFVEMVMKFLMQLIEMKGMSKLEEIRVGAFKLADRSVHFVMGELASQAVCPPKTLNFIEREGDSGTLKASDGRIDSNGDPLSRFVGVGEDKEWVLLSETGFQQKFDSLGRKNDREFPARGVLGSSHLRVSKRLFQKVTSIVLKVQPDNPVRIVGFGSDVPCRFCVRC